MKNKKNVIFLIILFVVILFIFPVIFFSRHPRHKDNPLLYLTIFGALTIGAIFWSLYNFKKKFGKWFPSDQELEKATPEKERKKWEEARSSKMSLLAIIGLIISLIGFILGYIWKSFFVVELFSIIGFTIAYPFGKKVLQTTEKGRKQLKGLKIVLIILWLSLAISFISKLIIPFINNPFLMQSLYKDIEDEILIWETYRNEEYGYEIKYPEKWVIREIEKALVHFTDKDPLNLPAGYPGPFCSFDLRIYDVIYSPFPEDIIDLIKQGEQEESLKVGGVSAVRSYFNEFKILPLGQSNSVIHSIYFQKDNDYQVILSGIKDGVSDINHCTDTFNQMLSSFRLLD